MPDLMFSAVRDHPSAAGYEEAAGQLLRALRDALSEKLDIALPELPVSAPATSVKHTRRTIVSRLWPRPSGTCTPATAVT
jgi:hypothetical protein